MKLIKTLGFLLISIIIQLIFAIIKAIISVFDFIIAIILIIKNTLIFLMTEISKQILKQDYGKINDK
ncbi:hypothetical protein Phi19:2_gp088 [Cellulophaga phage phi19:2]|uniref:Uncharacterized protein n=3 Tax=Cellulophaga phage phiST TaxID=756282 RepID=M4SPQ5_9CAUD|nr:hypothetical protein CGPG_00022 [Cellulophaga phage phiST]AGH56721.1 hypothetical protein CGPG_00022 [Cellulophaga phage phiST]AGO47227.1 hypothetical protein PhiST_gp088 [Cellulophaga phage phiST]AGO48723.1 hypothetical protein Phi19:2_gp088 [Cellulophaga phage phi19:2]AGO49093.1 hypothetical protein Phi13:1_gp082 [Cellulophaga phage phi13:1]